MNYTSCFSNPLQNASESLLYKVWGQTFNTSSNNCTNLKDLRLSSVRFSKGSAIQTRLDPLDNNLTDALVNRPWINVINKVLLTDKRSMKFGLWTWLHILATPSTLDPTSEALNYSCYLLRNFQDLGVKLLKPGMIIKIFSKLHIQSQWIKTDTTCSVRTRFQRPQASPPELQMLGRLGRDAGRGTRAAAVYQPIWERFDILTM